ncbi:hypothetical protein Val02_36740 [Virgisporangium aliadipatigenens]|uniref:Uncharacterized protein n=1 Tax=Virgisporangium aliadipatigenens TaxID=741659 RepID=A0A8J3YMF5_9ACTN|nr:hypothetical protein [Virgisporangium aliadipatigenens]GIJ46788.1 hypothetical protein Val02_36740 [Virgisporangium aliadipatigenens]
MNDIDAAVRDIAAALPPPGLSLDRVRARARARRRRSVAGRIAALLAALGAAAVTFPQMVPILNADPTPTPSAAAPHGRRIDLYAAAVPADPTPGQSPQPAGRTALAQLQSDGSVRWATLPFALGDTEEYVYLPDGRYAILDDTAGGAALVVVGADGREQLRRPLTGADPILLAASTGHAILRDDSGVRLHDLATGAEKVIRTAENGDLPLPTFGTAEGNRLAVISVEEKQYSCLVGIRDTVSGDRTGTVSAGARCGIVRPLLSPDGTKLAVRGTFLGDADRPEHRIRVVEVATGRILRDEVVPEPARARPGQVAYRGFGWWDEHRLTYAYGVAEQGRPDDVRGALKRFDFTV